MFCNSLYLSFIRFGKFVGKVDKVELLVSEGVDGSLIFLVVKKLYLEKCLMGHLQGLVCLVKMYDLSNG